MYRLTLTQNLSNYLPTNLPTPSVRRTYRWGDMWGILHNGEWKVEKRNQLQTEPYLLEEITELKNQAPPPLIDDVWDEEVVQIGDIIYNGGMIQVCLPGSVLKTWCASNKISVPMDLKSTYVPQITQPVISTQPKINNYPKSNYKSKFINKQTQKPKCMILDE